MTLIRSGGANKTAGLVVAAMLLLSQSACTKIENTWQYETYESRVEVVNQRVRVAVLDGLREARAQGQPGVPDDDAVPAQLFGGNGTLDPMIEQYGLDAEGLLRGDGPQLDLLLSELDLARQALETEKSKPEYLISDLL